MQSYEKSDYLTSVHRIVIVSEAKQSVHLYLQSECKHGESVHGEFVQDESVLRIVYR